MSDNINSKSEQVRGSEHTAAVTAASDLLINSTTSNAPRAPATPRNSIAMTSPRKNNIATPSSSSAASSPNRAAGIGLSPAQLQLIFPFHVCVDDKFHVVQVGKKFMDFMGGTNALRGRAMSDIFKILSSSSSSSSADSSKWDWVSLQKYSDDLIDLEFKENALLDHMSNASTKTRDIKFSGQLFVDTDSNTGSKTGIFLLSPLAYNYKELESYGMTESDLPAHSFQKETFEIEAQLAEANDRLKNFMQDIKTPLMLCTHEAETIKAVTIDIEQQLREKILTESHMKQNVAMIKSGAKNVLDTSQFMASTMEKNEAGLKLFDTSGERERHGSLSAHSSRRMSANHDFVGSQSARKSSNFNMHKQISGIKVHTVITGDLDADHEASMLLPLGETTDEALLAEVARRKLDVHKKITDRMVKTQYEFGKVLGMGASGAVYEVRHRTNENKYACKIVMKNSNMNDAQSMSTELEIMKRIRHRNVVSMYELYETPKCLWIILEHVDGGDLLHFLAHHTDISEVTVAKYFKQLLNGIHYLHSLGVVHRDLKLDNILVSGNGNKVDLKIADFGLSALVRVDEDGYDATESNKRKTYKALQDMWGTKEYFAPEVINEAYGPQADVWALGCVLYEMLSGDTAFQQQKSESELFVRIVTAAYDTSKSVWHTISEDAKDLLKHILTVDVVKRYSATECLQHPWVTGTAHTDTHMAPLEKMQLSMRARVERRKPKEAQQQQQAMRAQQQMEKSTEESDRKEAKALAAASAATTTTTTTTM